MSRSTRDLKRLLYFGLLFPLVALNVWMLGVVLTYFQQLVTLLIVSAILAFLLDYPVRAFEKIRIPRAIGIIIVLLLTVTLLTVVAVTVIPMLVNQSAQLFGNIPGWLEAAKSHGVALEAWAKQLNLPIDLQGFSGRLSGQIESQSQEFAKQALGFAIGTLSSFVDTMLVIVMAFYMLLYGGQLWDGMISVLPKPFGGAFSEALRLNFHNFFLSQFVLALFMTVTLIPVFIILKVPYALLFALLIGIAELIPFIGAALGIGSVFLLVMLQDFWLSWWVGLAAGLLQQIRDNLIAPKMMGDFTGLNPIWIFVALLLGLKIAGILGVFIAVPVAGTVKATIDALLQHQSDRQAILEATCDAQNDAQAIDETA
jgi:predicted PurR-regulated permease PerM